MGLCIFTVTFISPLPCLHTFWHVILLVCTFLGLLYSSHTMREGGRGSYTLNSDWYEYCARLKCGGVAINAQLHYEMLSLPHLTNSVAIISHQLLANICYLQLLVTLQTTSKVILPLHGNISIPYIV